MLIWPAISRENGGTYERNWWKYGHPGQSAGGGDPSGTHAIGADDAFAADGGPAGGERPTGQEATGGAHGWFGPLDSGPVGGGRRRAPAGPFAGLAGGWGVDLGLSRRGWGNWRRWLYPFARSRGYAPALR